MIVKRTKTFDNLWLALFSQDCVQCFYVWVHVGTSEYTLHRACVLPHCERVSIRANSPEIISVSLCKETLRRKALENAVSSGWQCLCIYFCAAASTVLFSLNFSFIQCRILLSNLHDTSSELMSLNTNLPLNMQLEANSFPGFRLTDSKLGFLFSHQNESQMQLKWY